jgi:hypothetical protein
MESRPRGDVPPYLRAQLARARGLLAAARGETAAAESHLGAAIEQFGSLGFPYWLAVARTDLAGVLIGERRVTDAGALLEEARATFAHLRAAPALQRADGMLAGAASAQSASIID